MKSFSTYISEPPNIMECIEKYKQTEAWKQSDVGVSGKDRQTDLAIRNSEIFTGDISELVSLMNNEYMIDIKNNVFSHFKDCIYHDAELLRYKVGSNFKPHSDRIRPRTIDKKIQLGTLLLIWYSQDAKGGELEVKDDSFTFKTLCEPKKDQQFQLAFIASEEIHQVTKLTNGTRYVYKETVSGLLPEDWPYKPDWAKALYDWFHPQTSPKYSGYSYRRSFERQQWFDNRRILLTEMSNFVRENGSPPGNAEDLMYYMTRWSQVKNRINWSELKD